MNFKLLIVDDEKNIREGLGTALELDGYEIALAADGDAGWKRFQRGDVDLVITDLRMPGISGEELLKRISSETPGVPVIVLTGHGTVETAVEAMRNGAYDFLTKPVNLDRLSLLVKRALSNRELALQNRRLMEDLERKKEFDNIVGTSAAMRKVFDTVRRVAPTKASVLITGESGVGKELIADALHELSPRKGKPLVKVHCAALASTLLESELFGHEKGAFTGAVAGRTGLVEAADGGTLFLDEIGELPLEAQARLLRVLQEGEIRRVGSVQSQKVDVRLIAATHRDLKALSKTGQFREDLFYRLNVISLKLPALRDREDDVLQIARAFLKRQSQRMGRGEMRFSPEAERTIGQYTWPGNVRELENAIERAVILCEGQSIPADLLGVDIELEELEDEDFAELPGPDVGGGHEPTEDLSLEDYFQHFVLEHQDHMTETELARKLGISRKCLWERRQRLGIPRRKSSAPSNS